MILDQWRRERPDLDLSAMAVFGRLAQLTQALTQTLDCVHARHGLRPGEFEVLATLRRSAPSYTLTPSTLADSLLMSRAGMTNRLDRLEEADLITRTLDPADRRSFQITLTPHGRHTIDAALTTHATTLARLTATLTPTQTDTLTQALRTLLHTITESATP